MTALRTDASSKLGGGLAFQEFPEPTRASPCPCGCETSHQPQPLANMRVPEILAREFQKFWHSRYREPSGFGEQGVLQLEMTCSSRGLAFQQFPEPTRASPCPCGCETSHQPHPLANMWVPEILAREFQKFWHSRYRKARRPPL